MIPAPITPRPCGGPKVRGFSIIFFFVIVVVVLATPSLSSPGTGSIEYIRADMSLDVVKITFPLGN
jgi:hypothetical protein